MEEEPRGPQAARLRQRKFELLDRFPTVLPSANLDQAVATAVKARILNNGQSCINSKRFIVAEPIADEFQRRFVEAMERLKIGDPFDENTDLGPLATARGLKDIADQVLRSVQAGAHILTGGKKLDRPGFFYTPTVMADVPRNSAGYSEELFGPVASLFPANSAKDAIRIANDTRYGLGASVWTNDEAERNQLIKDLEAGMVFVNRMVASDPRLPFGGVKWSGYGRELGVHGIREFTNIKTVWIQ
jgi:succinate-semialdehyde dehydrogenase / glutarate-semialdehyde dehydrogenase